MATIKSNTQLFRLRILTKQNNTIMTFIIPRTSMGMLCSILFFLFLFSSTSLTACINDFKLINQTQLDKDSNDIGYPDDDDDDGGDDDDDDDGNGGDDDDDDGNGSGYELFVFEVTFSITVTNNNVEQIHITLDEGRIEQAYFYVSGKGTYEFTTDVAIPAEKVKLKARGVNQNDSECGNKSIFVDGTKQTVLPVELVSFEGAETAEGNVIHWTTSYEDNTSHFVVEKSKDGKSWKELKSISAVGFSSQAQNYQTMDVSAEMLTYYRLRTVDFDGESQTSKIIVVERSDALITASLKAFPVPAINQPVTVNYHALINTTATISLVNQSGQLIQRFNQNMTSGLNSFTMDLSQQSKGFYFLTIVAAGEQQTTRLIKG